MLDRIWFEGGINAALKYLCYRDEKDFFDILRKIALKLINIEYDTFKEFHIF